MSLFDNVIPELFKKEIPKDAEFDAFFQRLNVDQFFNTLNNYWNPMSLMRKIGGIEKVDILLKDEDISAAYDKRIAALVDTKLMFEGPDEGLVNFFTDQITPFETQLKKDFFWTDYQGFGVEQIIYAEDGSQNVVGFQREQFWRFEPLPDLIHIRLIHTTNTAMRNKVLPWGKWVLTTKDGTHYNPMGNPTAEKLIQPWIFKCTGWDLWMDFAKRFANGWMHGKIDDEKKVESFRKTLEKAGKSAILVTDKNTTVDMIQTSRDSTIYMNIDSKTVDKINRTILGETLTSNGADASTKAATSVHNEVREEKTKADIIMVQDGINQIVEQMAAVFGIKGTLPKAKIIFDIGLNKELADRDKVLTDQGVKFNKKYYSTNYGLKEDQFEVVDKPAVSSFGFMDEKKRTFLTPDEVKSFLGYKNFSKCSHVTKLALEDDPAVARKANKSFNEKEDIVQLLSRLGEQPIYFDDLMAAINISKDQKELDQNLANLFDNRNPYFSELMSMAMYNAAAKGARMGNPKKIKPKDGE